MKELTGADCIAVQFFLLEFVILDFELGPRTRAKLFGDGAKRQTRLALSPLSASSTLVMSAPRPPPSNTNSPNGAPPAKRRRPAKKQGLRAPAAAPSSVPTGLSSTTSTPIDTPSMTPGTLTPPATSGGEGGRGFTNTRFADFLAQGAISQACMNGIASLRPVHEFCTEVQAATLPVILTGADVYVITTSTAAVASSADLFRVVYFSLLSLAQARTGTGKTLAFLIPSIESLLRAKPQPAAGHISILILSPTRELAIQIEEAARGLLSGTNYAVQHVSFLRMSEQTTSTSATMAQVYAVPQADPPPSSRASQVVGGTNMNSEINRLNKQRCDILVATPGRILDHLENSNLRSKLVACRALILDEADRLLEQGFRKEIVKIIECLPDRRQVPRQTLLFSATVPAQVHQIASLALLPNFTFITTLKPEEENTHKHVPQFSLIAPLEDQFATTLGAIKSELATHGAATKIMVFFPTARATGLAAALFKRCNIGLEIWEIHSRKSQSQRNAAAESYKLAKSGVLFSSDVTARGMDFPGVTTVIQTGLPQNTEQYVHRCVRFSAQLRFADH